VFPVSHLTSAFGMMKLKLGNENSTDRHIETRRSRQEGPGGAVLRERCRVPMLVQPINVRVQNAIQHEASIVGRL
jgi:hypothetical protein